MLAASETSPLCEDHKAIKESSSQCCPLAESQVSWEQACRGIPAACSLAGSSLWKHGLRGEVGAWISEPAARLWPIAALGLDACEAHSHGYHIDTKGNPPFCKCSHATQVSRHHKTLTLHGTSYFSIHAFGLSSSNFSKYHLELTLFGQE